MSGLSRSAAMEGSVVLTQEEDGIDSCTTNVVIVLDYGIFVGIDSRGTRISETEVRGGGKPWIIRKDNSTKYREVTCANESKVIITAAGYKGRMKSMWLYLEEKKMEIENFDKLVSLLKKFFKDDPVNDRDSACQLHVAGFSESNEAYMVYHIGDVMEEPGTFKASSPSFNAIGGGATIAFKALKKHAGSKMSYKKASDCIKDCLLNASLNHPRCGGDLNVFWLSGNGRYTHRDVKNCIDALLDEKFPFKPYSVLLFSSEEKEKMNYEVLDVCLSGTNAVKSQCLGKVNGDWTLFVSVFTEENQEHILSQGERMEAFKEPVFKLTLADLHGTAHFFWMCRAEHDILRDIRKNGLPAFPET